MPHLLKHHFYWFTVILFFVYTNSGAEKLDSVKGAPALAAAPAPVTKVDTTRPAPLVYHFESPWFLAQPCVVGAESPSECWRQQPKLANVGTGYPGIRAFTLSTSHWQKVPITSPYSSVWQHSPYLNSTGAPPEKYALQISGGDIQGIEEVWIPVIPLDTPSTRLDWGRGAFAMNIFNLKMRRMLSDHVYLGMDYYSASGDSLTYDYQFNVHQPYLGGFGIFGQIYGPIDRDSASLVLEGLSNQIQTTAIRPRVGVWLDTNRVLEFYFDYLKNSTSLTFPQGPNSFNGVARPGSIDSMQALMPSRFSTTSGGAIFGEHHANWSWQGEGSYSSLSNDEARALNTPPSQTAAAFSPDKLSADIFKIRATALGQKIFLQPSLQLSIQSETWSSDSVLTVPKQTAEGWTDHQEFLFGIRPTLKNLAFTADAGLDRSSRMDDQVFFLKRYGVSALLQLPFHLRAEVGLAGQEKDPEWQSLYRTNSARSLYANPALQPRSDQTYQASATWSWSRFSLESGVDLSRSKDAWQPLILPSESVCQDLMDSIYTGSPTIRCQKGNDSVARTLPDSLALALRNYAEEQLDGWHLGLAFGLGNWDLELRNHFLINRTLIDGSLKNDLEIWNVPARVFKGRLGWKRDLIENKLHLDFSWNWEWFSTRYAWASDLHGSSKLEKLDEYLALDFKAAMRIKTFTLFFRSMNMNHDRYSTEAGVHPPGINFRFGVDWELSN